MLVMRVPGSLLWAPSWHDIGLEEIAAFEQQRLVQAGGKRINKAVAEIEPRWMAAFAEARERVQCAVSLRAIDVDRLEAKDADKSDDIRRITLAAAKIDHHRLHARNSGYLRIRGGINGRCKGGPFRFVEQDGNQRGCIHHHQ